MARLLVVMVLMLMLIPGCATAKNGTRAGVVESDAPEMQDKSKDGSCDCCQKCNAAKGTQESRHEEGGGGKDGCGECCAKCGKKLQPRSQETPPEIIQKDVPPEVKGK